MREHKKNGPLLTAAGPLYDWRRCSEGRLLRAEDAVACDAQTGYDVGVFIQMIVLRCDEEIDATDFLSTNSTSSTIDCAGRVGSSKR